MRRWWLMVALLLSVGFNLGLLAAVVGGWWSSRTQAGVGAGVETAAVRPAADEAGDAEPLPPADDPAADAPVLSEDPRELGWDEGGPVELPEGAAGEDRVHGARDARPGSGEDEVPPVPGPRFGWGDDDPDAGPRPDGPPLARMADHLGLEGEVRERFLELQRRFVRDRVEIQRRGRVLTVAMHRELASPEPDADRVERLIDQRARLWREHEVLTARTILETRSILEPEQQRRYLQVLRRLMGGPGEGPPRGRPGAGPGARFRGEGRPRPGFGPAPPPPEEAPGPAHGGGAEGDSPDGGTEDRDGAASG